MIVIDLICYHLYMLLPWHIAKNKMVSNIILPYAGRYANRG